MGKAFSKMTPRIARVFFIVALQNYFKDHPEYKWSPDTNKTDLYIRTDYAEDARYQNIDPQIVVEGGSIRYSSSSIGNNIADYNIINSYQTETYHQFLAESNINIHCLASSSDTAEELGFEVAMFMQSLKNLTATVLQIQNMSMPQQSKPQLTSRTEAAGKYDSVVSMSYSFALMRKYTPLDAGTILNGITVYIDTPASTGVPATVPINSGTDSTNADAPPSTPINTTTTTSSTEGVGNVVGATDTLTFTITKDDIVVNEGTP